MDYDAKVDKIYESANKIPSNFILLHDTKHSDFFFVTESIKLAEPTCRASAVFLSQAKKRGVTVMW